MQFDLGTYWAAPDDLRLAVGEWLATLDHRDLLSHESLFGGASDGPAVDVVEWDGEGYRIRGWPPGWPSDDYGELIRRWVVPATPPPLALYQFALQHQHQTTSPGDHT